MCKGCIFKFLSLLLLQICSLYSADWIAYVTIDDFGPIVPIDVANSAVGTEIPLSGNQAINEVISPDGSTIYITTGDSVIVVDVATGTIVAQVSYSTIVSLPTFSGNGIAITPDGTIAYITGFDGASTGFVVPFITADNTFGMPIQYVNSGANFTVNNNIVITPDGQTAFVIPSFPVSSFIVPIDLTNQLAGSPINLGGFMAFCPMVVTPDGNSVYMSGGFRLLQVDVATLSFVTNIDLTFDVTQLALSPDGSIAYVSGASSTSIYSLDLATQLPTVLVTLPSTPAVIAITPDGKTIYAATTPSGSLFPIDVAAKTVGTLIDVQDVNYILFGPFSPPPTNLQGKQIKNRFIDRTTFANVLTWSLPADGIIPASYNIYRDSLSNLIGTSTTLSFIDYYVLPKTTYTYYVEAVSSEGIASLPISVTIAP